MTHPLAEEFEAVCKDDCAILALKDQTYKGSWHKRGGIGAFMMLARKWDRLEQIAEAHGYDIFKIIAKLDEYRDSEGHLLAEIGDLRRYLLLVESYMLRQRKDEEHVDKHYGVTPTSACPESVGQGGPDMRQSHRKMMGYTKCLFCQAIWMDKYEFCPNCEKPLVR